MSNILSQIFLAIGTVFSSVINLGTTGKPNQMVNTQQQAEQLQSLPSEDQKTIQELEKKLGNKLYLTVSKKTNKIASLTSPGKTIPIEASTPQGDSSEALARRFLTQYGNLFGITDGQNQLKYITSSGELADFLDTTTRRTIKLGSFNPQAVAHIKFQQIYNNIPVYASEIIVHIKANREVSSVTASIVPLVSLSTYPVVQGNAAKENSLQFITSKYPEVDQSTLTVEEPELVIIDDSLFTMSPKPAPYLTWLTKITSISAPLSEEVFVSATTGTVLGNISKITKLDRVIYNCGNNPNCPDFPDNPSALEGQTARDEASQKVYDFLGITHNYFKNTHGRNGANNQGGTSGGKTYGFANAATQEGSSYSDGWSVNIAPYQFMLDVVAHEFVHLIKTYVYIQQGGAVSEAVADILGNDVERKDWTLDQENGVVRSMENPASGYEPQPDRLFSNNYYCSFTDDLGSHHNNGVLNKAAYLIAQGGTFNGCTVTGIGREKMAKLVYATLVNYTGETANFRSFYDGMIASCNDTYGSGSNECAQVIKALQATEIDQQQSDTPWSSSCPQLCVKRTGNFLEECTQGQEGCECTEKVEYKIPLCATSSVISPVPTISAILTSTPTPVIGGVPTGTPTATLAAQPTTTNESTVTPTPTTNPEPAEGQPTPIPHNTTLQVDWVYEDQGRCWSAWAAPSCSLQNHQGQASLASRDLDHDGNTDITCSEGGTENSSTVTNNSNKTFSINCEYYTCNACTTDASGAFAQCDGTNFPDAQRTAETIQLTPGCTAICTASGAYGTCTFKGNLPQNQPNTPNPTSNPNTTNPPNPTNPIESTPTGTGPQGNQTPQNTSPTATGTPNNSVSTLISQINTSSIQDVLKNLVDDDELQGFDEQQTRYTGTTGFTTEFAYVKNYLENLNLTVETQEFNSVTSSLGGAYSCPNTAMKNLIVKIPGKKTAEPYLITAHFDSTSQSHDPAPGADDNGSGTVAVIEVAKALKNLSQQPENPIELVLFDAEEQGLCGSTYYVENIPQNKKIKGVINLDMIGNMGTNSCVNFYYENYTGGNVLSEKIVKAIDTYNINLSSQSQAKDLPSDHKSFTFKQIPAIIGSECSFSPVYHTENDKVEYINFDQITETAKAVTAAILELALTASPLPGQGTPLPTSTPTAAAPVPTGQIPPSPPPGSYLPVMIDYFHYKPEYSVGNTTTYIYAKTVDSAVGTTGDSGQTQKIEQELDALENVQGNVTKIVMTSTLATTEKILANHTDRLKQMGVVYIGYNTEPTTGTPGNRQDQSTELGGIFSTDPAQNSVAKFARLVQEHGFKSIFGPIRADAKNIAKNPDIIRAMVGSNCDLDGVAFQEQNQIPNQTAEERFQAVKDDGAKYRDIACSDFHISVQLMSSAHQCGTDPWPKCKEFLDKVTPYINSWAIWANRQGTNANELPTFIERLRE